MGGHNIGVQFERLLEIRYSFVQPPHEKLGLCKLLPTICIERIQVHSSAFQWKSFVKATEQGCRAGRRPYNLGISGIKSKRPLERSIRSSPIEVDLSLNPSQLRVGLGQVRVQGYGTLNCFTRKPVTLLSGNTIYVGLPVACSR